MLQLKDLWFTIGCQPYSKTPDECVVQIYYNGRRNIETYEEFWLQKLRKENEKEYQRIIEKYGDIYIHDIHIFNDNCLCATLDYFPKDGEEDPEWEERR